MSPRLQTSVCLPLPKVFFLFFHFFFPGVKKKSQKRHYIRSNGYAFLLTRALLLTSYFILLVFLALLQQPQIILLKDGTDSSQGKGQLLSNINACLAVVDTVRTTLGPRGMDKLIVDEKGTCVAPNYQAVRILRVTL